MMRDVETQNLKAAILEGDCARSVALAGHLSDSGVSAEHIVIHGIEAAMLALDDKCTLEHFNLLEIMLAGRAVMEVMKSLYPAGIPTDSPKGKVIVASLEGDVHDLGKNILKMVLTGKGYYVVDCGKDCPLQRLLDVAEEEKPIAVGISGLITPVIPLVRQVKDMMARRGLSRIKILAGGAALKQSSAEKLNVDFVAESAFDSARYLDDIAGGGR
jgi:methanogenic corrinoid protein MtbC1